MVASPTMRVRATILAPKRVTEKGAWKAITGTSRMPKNAFPVGRDSPVVFARNWHWRVDELENEGAARLRLLTAFNSHFEEYRAWLGVEFGKNMVVAARYEFHGDHPGWHCHAPCDDLDGTDLGALRARDCLRFPSGRGFHRSQKFDITSEGHALARSFEFFRVSGPKGELL